MYEAEKGSGWSNAIESSKWLHVYGHYSMFTLINFVGELYQSRRTQEWRIYYQWALWEGHILSMKRSVDEK